MFRLIRLFLIFLVFTVLPFVPGVVTGAVQMDEVVVEAGKIDEEEAVENDRSAFITVIKSEDFEKTSKTFTDVVEETVGLNVRKFGGDGSYSTASIRGSSASQVTILIDGIPLNRGKSGVVNLGNISLANVEKVEIYRGSSPLKFRASSIGGVINIVTKKGSDKTENNASITYGSFNSYDLKLLRSQTIENTSCLISANINGSDGDFEFHDDNGTQSNPNDDETADRINNDHLSYDIFGRLSHKLSNDFSIDTSINYFDKTQGIPGISSNQSENTSLDTKRTILNTKLKKENLINQGNSGEITLWVLNEETWYDDKYGEMGTGSQSNHSHNRAGGIDAFVSYYAGDYNLISLILSVQHEYFDSKDSSNNFDGASQKRTLYQCGLSDEISLLNDSLTIVPQVMYSYYDNNFGGSISLLGDDVPEIDDDDSVTLKLGAEYMLADNLFLKMNLGRYYRYPNFSELFGDEGNIIGNPELTPEVGLNSDIGIYFTKNNFGDFNSVFNNLSFELVFFKNRVEDLILFTQNSQRVIQASNISEAEVYGVELSAGIGMYDHLLLSGNLTYNDAEDTSSNPSYNGKQLPGIPEFDSAVKIELYNKKIRFFYEYNYLAESYMDSYNKYYLNKREQHNFGTIYTINKKITLTLEALNISDDQKRDVMGFALPGRSFSGTVQMKF